MNLPDTVEGLLGQSLPKEERDALHRFMDQYGIDDDDPLIVVLAMMARNKAMLDGLPDLLQQKAVATIELHQQTLREQSTVIAKELIVAVGNIVAETAVGKKLRTAWIALAFTLGFIGGGLAVWLMHR